MGILLEIPGVSRQPLFTCPGKASRNPSVISTRIPQLSYQIKNLKSISPTLIMKGERLASVSTMQYASLWGQGARGGGKICICHLIPLSRTLAPNWTTWASKHFEKVASTIMAHFGARVRGGGSMHLSFYPPLSHPGPKLDHLSLKTLWKSGQYHYGSLWGQGARGGDKYAFAILIPLSRTLAPNWTIWASNTLI